MCDKRASRYISSIPGGRFSRKSLKFENRQIEPCLTRHAQGNHDGLYRQQGPADWIFVLELAWEWGDHLGGVKKPIMEQIR